MSIDVEVLKCHRYKGWMILQNSDKRSWSIAKLSPNHATFHTLDIVCPTLKYAKQLINKVNEKIGVK